MKARRWILSVFLGAFLIAAHGISADCAEKRRDIREIPMYGNIEKNELHKQADQLFIKQAVTGAGSREKAAEQMLEVAWGHYHANEFGLAMRRFNQAWLLDPNEADAYLGFGLLLRKQNDLKGALEMYDRALQLDPRMAEAYTNRGNLLRHQGDTEKAMADYARAIESNPDFMLAYANRGILHFRTKKFDEAIADFSRAIELAPKDPQNYSDRGAVYLFMKDHEKAKQDAEKAIDLGYINPVFLKDLHEALKREALKGESS